MTGLNVYDLLYLSPEMLLIVFGMVLLFIKKHKMLAFFISLAGLSSSLVFNFFLFGQNTSIIFDTLDISDISTFIRMMILIGTLVLVIASKEFAEDLEYTNLYYAFLSFATVGMIVLPSANDLLTIFIAFELTSISTYALPFIDQRQDRRFEAGVKYFLTGAFSSGLILFGMSYLFGLTGSLYVSEIMVNLQAYQGSPIVYLAFALILGGLSYKMALAPFHLWAPDTYTGSAGPVTGYLAGITKKGPFALAIKLFLITFMSIKFEMMIALGVLAVLTMTVGNLAALMQQDVKRMLAYSSVANAGTILIGFAIGNVYAISGAVLHIGAHLLMTVGVFMVIYYMESRYKDSTLEGFRGFNRKEPLMAFAMTIMLLSLGGIPPLLGFWSKLIIVFGAVQAGSWFLILALALILNSALSLAYYFKVIKYMYMKDPEGESVNDGLIGRVNYSFTRAGIYLTALLLLLTGLIPGTVLRGIISAVEQLPG